MRNFTKWFSENSEYMLVYAKDNTKAQFSDVAIDDEIRESFNLIEADGRRYRLEPFMRSRTETLRENKPNFWYPLYVSKDLSEITRERKSGYYEIYPIASTGKEATWINLPETFDEKVNNGYFIAKKEDEKINIYRKLYEMQIYKNVWIDKKYQSEFNGTKILKEILGENKFEYPKSLYLIMDILKITSPNSATILDFFAGSGTTGHAVMELNNTGVGGDKRHFILCTNNENNICRDVTYERIKRVIKKEDYKASLKYYKIDYIPISDKVYYEYADELLLHIRELVELENGINFLGNDKTAIVLTAQELDDFIKNIKQHKNCRKLYRANNVLISHEQRQKLKDAHITMRVIPDYYYGEKDL